MAEELPLLQTIMVDPNKIIYQGEAVRVFIPTKIGEIALLPYHTPLYTELTQGEVKIEEKNGSNQNFPVEGGIVRVKENTLKILVGF
jgi:F-type H+-transporting ATPase subunit epsilon